MFARVALLLMAIAAGALALGGVGGLVSVIFCGASILMWLSARQGQRKASQQEAHQSQGSAPTNLRPRAEQGGQSDVTGARGAHFERHARTPGWLYVARNEMHAPDLYKVGYTVTGPESRMRWLNRETAGVTAAVGQFRCVHKRKVPRSREAEREVFRRLAQYRVQTHREFFRAPLRVVNEVVDAVADELAVRVAEAPASIHATCPGCGRSQLVDAAMIDGQTYLYCPPCGTAWVHDAREQ